MALNDRTNFIRPFCYIFIILLSFVTSSYGLGVNYIFDMEITPTTISVEWLVNSGTSWEYYTVDIAPPSGNSVNGYPAETTEMEFTFTGLRPNTVYTITVTPWNGMESGAARDEDLTTEEIPTGEILVTDITPNSAFVQWKDYGAPFYMIVASPPEAANNVTGIFNPEVELAVSMPETVILVRVLDNLGTLRASGNFTSMTSGSTDVCSMENPPETCRSGSIAIHPNISLVVNVLFFIGFVTRLLPR